MSASTPDFPLMFVSAADGSLNPTSRLKGSALSDPLLAGVEFNVVLGRTDKEFAVSVTPDTLSYFQNQGIKPLDAFRKAAEFVQQIVASNGPLSCIQTQSASGVWGAVKGFQLPSPSLIEDHVGNPHPTKSKSHP